MLLTEEEAKTKWCPFASPVKQINSQTGEETMRSRSPSGGTMLGCRCIASECMAWRWKDGKGSKVEDRETLQEGYPSGDGGVSQTSLETPGKPKDTAIVERVTTVFYHNRARRGFCGLAERAE